VNALWEKEKVMTMMRLLLPFTQRVDVRAIDAALMLAQQRDATLVAFSPICSSGTQAMRGAQPEYRQPSGDFLEVVQ
jgi:RNase P/RNase MRP subunit POP5